MTNKKMVLGMLVMALTMSAASMLAVSCGMSKADLEDQVKAAIEEYWEEEGLDIKIKDLSLVKLTKNEYLGVLEVEGYGESEVLSVSVTTDGDTFIWQIEE
jgi:hypothetical protein